MKTELLTAMQKRKMFNSIPNHDLDTTQPIYNYIDYLENRIRDYDSLVGNVQHAAENMLQKPSDIERLNKAVEITTLNKEV